MTPKLPAASAVELLAMHERIAHGSNASAILNVKPEKFPRPNVGLDEPIEKWEDFNLSWQQYKEEYGLSGKKLTRHAVHPTWLPACQEFQGGSISSYKKRRS